MEALIFYGAGRYAQRNLDECIKNGLTPVCFVDSDERKHYTKLGGGGYDILPLNKAMEMYPDAVICIMARNYWVEIYDDLINQGISTSRIASIVNNKIIKSTGIPQYCPRIGQEIAIDGNGVSTCCKAGYRTTIASGGNIKNDIIKYKKFCNRLREDLNQGRLTCCTGCPELQDGSSSEKKLIRTVILGTALPGHESCNFKCSYCTYELETKKAWDKRSDNIIDIFRGIEAISSVKLINYLSSEITISPFKYDMINIWRKNGWSGSIATNASVYIEELAIMASKQKINFVVSLDSGTKETFQKIKGVDCFDKVVENIKKYVQMGVEINLKYIILENVNTEEADLKGFIKVSKDINAVIHVVRDNRFIKAISPCEQQTMEKIKALADELNVIVSLYDHFNLISNDVIH